MAMRLDLWSKPGLHVPLWRHPESERLGHRAPRTDPGARAHSNRGRVSVGQQRRQRVAAVYEQTKREYPARQVEIPVTRQTRIHTLASLPSGIELGGNGSRIRFSSFKEFLTKLFELGQAVQRLRRFRGVHRGQLI